MSILVWLALGLLAGVVGGWLWGSRGRPLAADAAVAVLGAVLGGFMASVSLGLDISGFEGTSVFVAGLGALLLLVILHALPETDLLE